MVKETVDYAIDHFHGPIGTRLLPVDDNAKLCRIVKEYLEPLGYDVAVAQKGPDRRDASRDGWFHGVEAGRAFRKKASFGRLEVDIRLQPASSAAGS